MASESTDGAQVDGAEERYDGNVDQVRRELEEAFNLQRAKMKDLFLQKEEDLRKMLLEKQQLQSEVMGLRAELQQLQTLSENQVSEIQSLQLLVNETVEASSSGSEEVRRLQTRLIEMDQQMQQLRQQQQQQDVSLAPATLVRSLARKLGADTDLELTNKKTGDENELLRSVIQPMEMEIAALKNKLRDTDTQLQQALKNKPVVNTGASSGDSKGEETSRKCDMCENYEKQLVSEQKQSESAREKAVMLDQALKLATEELEGVRSLHDETVRAWRSDRANAARQLDELTKAVEEARSKVESGVTAAELATQRTLQHVTSITVDRETLHKTLESLERDNAILIGRYTKKATDMQNEVINLPDDVEELQELTLRLREQLILCELGREDALETEQQLRQQLLQLNAEQHRRQIEIDTLKAECSKAREQLDRLQTEHEQMKELGDKLRHSNDMIEQLLEDKKRLQTEVSETRSRVLVLQQDLDNSEKVQQDFVRLSQSLQVQLQRIREADSEVRWQHDEDVLECPVCHVSLPNNKKKVHCRHCGRIFCSSCVSEVVASGPRRAPARVCRVCRTLLQPHAAPYFSTSPPHTPH